MVSMLEYFPIFRRRAVQKLGRCCSRDFSVVKVDLPRVFVWINGQYAIAQFVAYVPAYAEDNNLAVEMPILEKGIEAARGRHDRLPVKARSVYPTDGPDVVAPEPENASQDNTHVNSWYISHPIFYR